MSLDKEIAAAIEKDLPNKVGKELKKVLEDYESLKKDHEDLKEEVKSKSILIDQQNDQISDLMDLGIRAKDLKEKEKDIEEREKSMDITILETKLEAAEERAKTVTGFVNSLVKNTIVKKSVLDSSTSGGYTDTSGNWVDTRTTTRDINETEEKE